VSRKNSPEKISLIINGKGKFSKSNPHVEKASLTKTRQGGMIGGLLVIDKIGTLEHEQ